MKHKNVFAIGDIAQFNDKNNSVVASTAHAAEQSVEIAAMNIKLDLEGKELQKKSVNMEGGIGCLRKKMPLLYYLTNLNFLASLAIY